MNATVKRIVELLFQDVEMTDEVKALETEIEEQKQAFAKAEDAYRASADRQAAIITALDWLGELERYYNAGKLNTARETAQAMRQRTRSVSSGLSAAHLGRRRL